MTDTIDVSNASRSDITLPCGTKVPGGATVPVLIKNLVDHQGHPVVHHLLEERILRADGSMADWHDARSGSSEMQAEIDRLRQDLYEAHAVFDAERDQLVSDRDAAIENAQTERAAREAAEAATKAAIDELAKVQAEAAKKSGKPA